MAFRSWERRRYRVLQAAEVILFVGLALLLFALDPFPTWPANVSRRVILSMVGSAFLVYVAFRTRDWKVDELPEKLEAAPQAAQGRYQVPRRISLMGICGITVVAALLVSGLQMFDAPVPVICAVIGFASMIAAAQLFWQNVPQLASTLSGALVGGFVVVAWEDLRLALDFLLPHVLPVPLFGVVVGALLGYFAGVFAASVFLVGDALRLWFVGPHDNAALPHST